MELSDEDPYRPARDDRAAVISRIIDRLPERVDATLAGDREALIGLLLITADAAWQSRAEVLGTIEEVAAAAHQFADDVAECYSSAQSPPDQLCDTGFALADRVDALAVELLQRRAADDTRTHAEIGQLPAHAAREARHLARAHAAALRDAVGTGRQITSFDAAAAEDLYRAVVALGRQQTALAVQAALARQTTGRAAPPSTPPPPTGRSAPPTHADGAG